MGIISVSLYLTVFLLSASIQRIWCSYCYRQRRSSYTTVCGWLEWDRCNRARYHTETYCCPGWTGTGCAFAICDGKTDEDGAACNTHEGYVRESASGPVRTSGGGNCTTHENCTNCYSGYYADGPHCRACPSIDNCYHTSCTSRYSVKRCHYCHGVVKDDSTQYGWWAFTRWTDGGLTCKRACSWRAGSRCYPGNCPDNTASSCNCTEGFSGTDCATITENPKIMRSSATLKQVTSTSEERVEGPPNPATPSPQETVWTNKVSLTTAYVHVQAQYVKSLPVTPSTFYVDLQNSAVGIMSGGVTLQLTRGGSLVQNSFSHACPSSIPKPNGYSCDGNFIFAEKWSGSLPFRHLDTIVFTTYATNGGYITVFDRENNDKQLKTNMIGKTVRYTYEFKFDTVDPAHCKMDSSCFEDPLTAPDILKNAIFNVHWDGWRDNTSGMKSYNLEVFHLRPSGIGTDSDLSHGDKVVDAAPEEITAGIKWATVTLPSAGPYSVILTVVDKAGNKKSARAVILYDDKPVVQLQGTRTSTSDSDGGCTWKGNSSALLVTNANPESNCEWINHPTSSINIAWKNRFINIIHDAGSWLNSVAPLKYIDDVLDDHAGTRQTSRIDNILGIVKFEVSFNVTYENKEQQFPFFKIDELYAERTIISEDMQDGKRLNVTVRGYDITGAYIDDYVVVKADASPPIIKNLWLTRGDVLNISVHNVKELASLTIEWETYDYHSGIHHVQWRLYSNNTEEDVQHGMASETPQGITETLVNCVQTYSRYARGPRCYCTPFDGCFHQHFQVKPDVVKWNYSGITLGKHIATHDFDYFIEVIVTNKAMLTTVSTIKLTIDTTSPIAGAVYEGMVGKPEVDFQQSLTIHVHWNDFFDKESGVWFYKYGNGSQCLQDHAFDVDSNDELTLEYNQYASFDVAIEGTYYVTVAAYNRALDHSVPVCSDGITIDTSVPVVHEVIVQGARTLPGLLKTGDGKVWYIYEDRSIQKVEDPSDICRTSAKEISDAEFITLPHRTDTVGRSKNLTNTVCDTASTAHQDLLSVISSTSAIEISWYVQTPETHIHDFRVGLGSTYTREPDVVPFESSHRHHHIRLRNPNLDDGEIVYVVIETVSKAEVTNTQVIGRFLVDTSPPNFQGEITVMYKSGFLVARWNPHAFVDSEDNNGLRMEFAVGNIPNGVDIHPFSRLQSGAGCIIAERPSCTAVGIDELDWSLHVRHTYYITIKATNTGGHYVLATSDPYIHDILLPTKGVVLDTDDLEDVHMSDVDFQTSLTTMNAKWYGFERPGTNVQYTACIAKEGTINHSTCAEVGNVSEIVLDNLQLSYFKTYQFVIIARSSAGNITVMSDGVTTIDTTVTLHNIKLYDGVPCGTDPGFVNGKFLHHAQDIVGPCEEDISHQSSLNSLSIHWDIPETYKNYTPDLFWHIQERAPVVDYWTSVTDHTHTSVSANQITTNHVMQSGRSYRFAVQFCASRFCFPEMFTDGVTIIHNPPTFGSFVLDYSETELMITVTLEKFHDSDIEDITEAQQAISHYEWALSDNGHTGRTLTNWTRVSNIISTDNYNISFSIPLKSAIQFTNCWKVGVRGYNKAGLSSIVSGEIRPCAQVPHPIVIDAVGKTVIQNDGTEVAENISLAENSKWFETDIDYTPVTNMVSAIWPSLRYPVYEWAILEYISNDPILYYKEISDLDLKSPCDIPETIACGNTSDVYINANMEPGLLVPGKKYIVCIHANSTVLPHESWDEPLPGINACSDGVTVDTSPPTPGLVWISKQNALYQTSLSDLTVYWQSFVDVEELRNAVHSTGIVKYEVAIGTHYGDVDVVDFRDVGVANHITLHGLTLQNGHKYYATVKGYDFTGKTASSVSAPVITDKTQPVVSNVGITIGSRHITDKNNAAPCWTGLFSDPESGISVYRWGVGSTAGYDDVFPYTDSVNECDQTDQTTMSNLQEGRMYYISVMAYNGAGLWTLATSWSFTVDFSPPNAGHVYDGRQDIEDNLRDQDYQSDRHYLLAYWSGFTDPHTNIKEYFIEIGTSKERDDILQSRSVGLNQELRLEHLELTEGSTYFVKVTACNTADLCSSATSDGITIDSSTPVPGRVNDGVEITDIQYQLSRELVAARWIGFVDSQSGISHYTWRVGTTRGGDDIVPAREVHRSSIAVISNIEDTFGRLLPVGIRLYSTVRAYNKAGLWSESTSNGFTVDDTGPVIVSPISHISLGSLVQSTSVLKSVLKLEWDIIDEESYIERQYVSIMPHVGEDFNISVEVHGFIRDYTFTKLKFHDGSFYDVILVSCNGARACVKSMLKSILVDTSPPTAGTLAINTDHAAELDRQPDAWMVWNTSSIKLSWLGFSDEHSGVSYYMINVGSHYMGADLNQIPGTAYKVEHDKSTVHRATDGKVQVYTIPTQNLDEYQHVFIAIWAVNGVGLRSDIVHSQFSLIPGGAMALVRRCSSYSCQGHCVCAPQDMKCPLTSDSPKCNKVTGDSNFDSVSDLIYLSNEPINNKLDTHTPVNSMLSAEWHITERNDNVSQWYEWSIGMTKYDTPSGIFSHQERMWHDAADTTTLNCTLKNGMTLYDGERYSVFIRAWYDGTSFADFKSAGVIIQSKHPETSNLFGKTVKEVYYNTSKDLDYVSYGRNISIDWTGKFKSSSENIWKYRVFLSSYPGGHDLHVYDRDVPADITMVNLTLQDLNIEPGVRYFSTVQAYNHAGLHKAVISDGFVLDTDPPTAGIVLDGTGIRDLQYQNSSHLVSANWHGFSDLHSSVISYKWCVSTADSVGACNIVPYTDVGLRTHASNRLTTDIENGMKIISEVVAVDGVGHVSVVAASNGVVIDTTPPHRLTIAGVGQNLLQNPSFELLTEYLDLKNFLPARECTSLPVRDWVTDGCSTVLVSSAYNVQNGHSFVWIRGSISQNISDIQAGKYYKLTFHVSHLPASNNVASHEEGFIDFAENRQMFMVYSKPGRHDSGHSLAWQLYTFYFEANERSNILTIGSVDRSYGIALDNVHFQEVVHDLNSDQSSNHVVGHPVFVHDWSSVHASWKFDDKESGIKEYMWAVGTVKGGTQLQEFRNVGTSTFATNSKLHLPHKYQIYITVVATNRASLKTISYSDPILVDLTPPIILNVYDGLTEGVDIDFQDSFLVGTNFDVNDPESSINSCYWAIGTTSGDSSISAFTEVTGEQRYASVLLNDTIDITNKLYISVRCVNSAGLATTRTSDGVQIIVNKPSVDGVHIDVLETSVTQYPVFDNFHGRSDQLRLRWTGFKTNDWIDHYQIEVKGDGYTGSVVAQDQTPGYVYATLDDLALDNGVYVISVKGVNKMNVESDTVVTNVTILTTTPLVNGTQDILISWDSKKEEAIVSWSDVFRSQHQLYYEVSVGKSIGNVDIIQWQETRQTQLLFKLPSSDVGQSGIDIFATVRAISPSGMYATAFAQQLVV